MTREQKLALVLGFAAVLVVGLLISDHLAAARSTDLEDAPHDSTVVIDSSEGEAIRRVVTLPPTKDEFRGRPVTRMSERPLAAAPGDHASVVATVPDVEPIENLPDAPVEFILGENGGEQSPGSESVIGRVGNALAKGAEEFGGRLRTLTNGVGDTRIDSMAMIDGQPVSREVPTSPVVVQHNVQANESLYKIAARYYGDGNTWRRIAKDNPGRVGDTGSVREGVTLRILDPTQGTTSVQGSARATSTPLEQRTPKPTQDSLTYTVKSGDTLGEISQAVLGTIRRQHELIALNRDVLKDPDQLRAGMVLRLPSS